MVMMVGVVMVQSGGDDGGGDNGGVVMVVGVVMVRSGGDDGGGDNVDGVVMVMVVGLVMVMAGYLKYVRVYVCECMICVCMCTSGRVGQISLTLISCTPLLSPSTELSASTTVPCPPRMLNLSSRKVTSCTHFFQQPGVAQTGQ